MSPSTTPNKLHGEPGRGTTMVEMLIVISIIGVLSSIAVVGYKKIMDNSTAALTGSFVEELNNGLKEFEQNCWKVDVAADDNGTTEEQNILWAIQYQDPQHFGSPYFRQDWSPAESTDTEMFRIRWNGANFQLIPIGTAGNGLEFNPDGSDFIQTTFPDPFDAHASTTTP